MYAIKDADQPSHKCFFVCAVFIYLFIYLFIFIYLLEWVAVDVMALCVCGGGAHLAISRSYSFCSSGDCLKPYMDSDPEKEEAGYNRNLKNSIISVTGQAGLSLTWSQTRKTWLPVTLLERPLLYQVYKHI